VSRTGQIALFVVAVWAAAAAPADAQNLDAGKSPAQIFSDTCAVCHRSTRAVGRTSAAFLRQHYMTGYEEASAMANYLSGVPSSDPRGAQPRRPPAPIIGAGLTEPVRQQPKEQPKQQASVEQAKAGQSGQAQTRGKRPGPAAEVTQVQAATVLEDRSTTERTEPAMTDRAAGSVALPSPPPPAPPPRVALEPFEE
jgi:hypothetical protein